MIIGLDGKKYRWNLLKYNKESKHCSKLHIRARQLLKKLFKFEVILEEVLLPGSKILARAHPLRGDFYIDSRKIMIEIHGEQHYKFNPHFYKTKLDFIRAQACDRDKKLWCSVNAIRLIELPYDENNTEWEKRILGD